MRPFTINLIGLIVLICLPASFCCSPDQARAAEEVKLYYEENAQVELIAPQGRRILIDVHDPSGLSRPPVSKDILLTTHNHADHRRLDFVKAFPGQQLDVRTGKIQLAEVSIQGIASSHNEGGDFR